MNADAPLPPDGASPRPEPCSFRLRILNLIVDLICLYVALYVLALILGADLGVLRALSRVPIVGDPGSFVLLLLIAGAFAFYFLFEYRLGRTPGKLLTNTRLMAPTGQAPSRRAILLRTLVRFIPFEWISFFKATPVGWHDSLSGTIVVEERKAGEAHGAP